MPGLRELQQAMSAAILGGARPDAENHIVTDGLAAAERLNIYRNTFLAAVTQALRLSYPAVQRLVGGEFFEGAARHFIENHPPESAYLNRYGEGFADFLAQFPPAASLAYLADVARLEWAVNCALHAPDAAPLDMALLSDSPSEGLRFVAHPSVAFMRASHPADAIWRAVLAGDDSALAAIDLCTGPVWLMIARLGDRIDVSRLRETEWRFSAALCAGAPLASVLPGAEGANLPAVLAHHLARGVFADFEISDNSDF